jgi:hypothetical protein
MKRRIFTPLNSKAMKPSTPSVNMNAKAGLINISKAACEILNLSKGDKVVLFQDEDAKRDWYLEKNPVGFELRDDGKTASLSFNCTAVVRELFKSVGYEKQAGRMVVGEKVCLHAGEVYAPIITSSLPKDSE